MNNLTSNELFHKNTHNDDKKAEVGEHIKVYLRLRPNYHKTEFINIDNNTNSIEYTIDIKERLIKEYINNSKEKYNFCFNKIFNQTTTQADIFNNIAKEVCDSAINGYNGTIFAYGQTGSGKTYTITGGVERYEERGIIPRSLTYIFQEIKNKPNTKYTIRVSYLEIYNNEGYDLLHQSNNQAFKLEDLPKVIMRENKDKQLLLYNLSSHQVNDEEEALLLLMIGDDNRVVAETPKNDASTRSHCIFMIQIESITSEITNSDNSLNKIENKNENDNDNNYEINQVRTVSKLHIVDLSGSEKASKTEYKTNVRFDEAKNINVSLHFLGQVISSINKKQLHVPYRNTMMTMVLRDSLGGNCKTRMIATVSSLPEDLPESISTCRFAQNVSLVKNVIRKNEIEDPEILIKKQRNEIDELRNELKLIKGEDQKDFLEEKDIEKCKSIINNFLSSNNNAENEYNDILKLKDMLMIKECFYQIKLKYKQLENNIKLHKDSEEINNSKIKNCVNCSNTENIFKNEIDKLKSDINKAKDIIKRKDDEIKGLLLYFEKIKSSKNIVNSTLLNKINKEEENLLENQISSIRDNYLGEELHFDKDKTESQTDFSVASSKNNTKKNTISSLNNLNNSKTLPIALINELNRVNCFLKPGLLDAINGDINPDIISDSKKSYEYFKKNYIKSNIHEDNLNKLQKLFNEGKDLALQNETIRKSMNSTKLRIEELKKEYKIKSYNDSDNKPPMEYRNREDSLYNDMSKLKKEYDINCNFLKKAMDDVEFLKKIIENNSTKMGRDFNQWHYVHVKILEFKNKNKLKLNNDFNLKINYSDNNTISSTKNNNSLFGSNILGNISSNNSNKLYQNNYFDNISNKTKRNNNTDIEKNVNEDMTKRKSVINNDSKYSSEIKNLLSQAKDIINKDKIIK